MSLSRHVVTGRVVLTDEGLAVPRWLRKARPLVAQAGISGGLLFDGEQWLQLIEGAPAATDALLATMAIDVALGTPSRLYASLGDPHERLCTGWLIGYLEPEELTQLHDGVVADGFVAVLALASALRRADAM